MKQAQRKDFFREIWKSRNRFFSILLIVALGVAFYAGVRSSEPDMRLTADGLYDETNFMDIRVISTLGLTDGDLEELRQIPGVLAAEPGMQTEAFCTTGDTSRIMQVFSLGDTINRMDIIEGRLPQKPGECFADVVFMNDTGTGVGDTVTLSSGEFEEDGSLKELSDTLNRDTYTIVGYGNYSWYLSWDRGTASIGNGNTDAFLGILPEDFHQDPDAAGGSPVYYTIFVTVDGAKELDSYSDEYESRVDEVCERIEAVADARCDLRYETVQADAKSKIEDAKARIADGEKQVTDGDQELADVERKLADAEKELSDKKQELADKKQEFNKEKQEFGSKKQEFEDKKQELADGRKKYEDGVKELAGKEKELEEAKGQLTQAKKELDEQTKILEKAKAEYESGQEQLALAEQELAAEEQRLAAAEEQFFAGFAALGMTDREEILAYVAQDEELSSRYQEIQDGKAAVLAGKKELDTQRLVLEASGQEIAEGEARLAEGGKEWQDSWNLYSEGEQEVKKAKKQLAASEKELTDGEAQLADAAWQIADGEEQLADGEAQLADGEEKLAEADTELADARKEYEEKKTEAEADLSEARADIEEGKADVAEAEQSLADLKYPEWFVGKRSDSIQTFVEFGQDAERIGAIGKVFPAIFFLVAALVSLTTMTRMVEEERTQIGTLKALGYSKSSIASKYILYALSACLGGGVLGVLVGSKLFPFVIIKAYGILYATLPAPVLPLHLNLALASIAIAVLCTVAATAFASFQELSGVPADLMRPAAPKQGKRVLLERVTIVWKHLSFTWKATIRNLFRYKKRLLMTIFGIGGCMALLMVGFGLRDSIQQIVKNQYQTIWTYDAYLSLDEDSSEEEKVDFISNLAADEAAVEETLCIRESAMDVEAGGITKNANLFVPQTTENLNNFLVLKDRLSGERYELREDGAVISEKLARMLGLSVGDTLYLVKSETEKLPVTVTAIAENYLHHYVYLTDGMYRRLFGEAPSYNELFLKLSALDDMHKEELSNRLLEEDMIQSLTYVADLQAKVSDMMHSLDLVVWVLIAAAGLLAFVVLYNLNNISIMERRRELATIKVLGFYDLEVAEYVYRENVLLTAFGIAAGVLMGLVLHQFVIRTCEIDMIMFGRVIQPFSYLFSILLTVVFAAVVNFSMFYKLRKIDMVESLKSVE